MRCPLAAAAVLSVAAGPLAGCGSRPPAGQNPPLFSFGRTGMGPGEFNYPRAACVGPDGLLYVVDKAGRMQAFTQSGELVRAWRMPLIDAGKPTGLGIGPEGRVYAADTHYNRVMVFEADGTPAGQFGRFGDGPGQFRLPTDVALDADGYIYVSEYGGNDRISKFSPRREYLFSFGGREAGEGRLNRPQSVWIAADGTLWVADACNHRICRFDRDGRYLGSFGRLGGGPGELRFPYNVVVLPDGTLVVCEYGNNRLQRFDASGRSQGVWGRPGRKPGELAYPWALALGADDRLFVIDSGNNRVQVLAGRSASTWTRPIEHPARTSPQ